MHNPNQISNLAKNCDAFLNRADRALSTKEAAAILGLSHKTLNNWRCQGKGPAFQKGPGPQGAVRYPLSTLSAWRSEHMRKSTSDQGGGNAR